jgi:hypothetical protein
VTAYIGLAVTGFISVGYGYPFADRMPPARAQALTLYARPQPTAAVNLGLVLLAMTLYLLSRRTSAATAAGEPSAVGESLAIPVGRFSADAPRPTVTPLYDCHQGARWQQGQHWCHGSQGNYPHSKHRRPAPMDVGLRREYRHGPEFLSDVVAP